MAGGAHQPEPFEQGGLDEEFRQARGHDHDQRISLEERFTRNLDSESYVGQRRGPPDGWRELGNAAAARKNFGHQFGWLHAVLKAVSMKVESARYMEAVRMRSHVKRFVLAGSIAVLAFSFGLRAQMAQPAGAAKAA